MTIDLAPAPAQRRAPAEESIPAVATYKVAEFFAGIGLARMGLERSRAFQVTWANDLDPTKQAMYLRHFGESERDHYKLGDIKDVAENLPAAQLPSDLSLAWASFPCTDLSLAGGRMGLAGKHSGTFWNFTDVLQKLGEKRPPVVVLENVNGFATSHGGADLRAAVQRLNELEYSVDVITLDARSWVPQSRPRLFLIASETKPLQEVERNAILRPSWLDPIFNDEKLNTHRADIPAPPPGKKAGFTEIAEQIPSDDPQWWESERVDRFRSELSDYQLKRLAELGRQGTEVYRTAYRRTREGKPAWEIRADDIAGCLRTARGGSSKQAVVRIKADEPLRVRWMTAGEYASLMGAGNYKLPERRSQAVMGFGDAVCVDAVQWLAENYLEPLLSGKLIENAP